jgi:hypothetical protein
MTIKIISARYGVPGNEKDVTEGTQMAMQFGNRRIAINNQAMGGDPAYGKLKHLTVTYIHNDGAPQTVAGVEGSILVLGGDASGLAGLRGDDIL